MTRDEWLARFKAEMIHLAPFDRFDPTETHPEGETVSSYADAIGPSYWDDETQRAEGPEDCAEADFSEWGN
jgi:hypothetical protein